MQKHSINQLGLIEYSLVKSVFPSAIGGLKSATREK